MKAGTHFWPISSEWDFRQSEVHGMRILSSRELFNFNPALIHEGACHRVVAAFVVLLGGWVDSIALGRSCQLQSRKPFPVSLIRVIANPEKCDGHRMRVIGVLGYGGGPDQAVCLYFSEMHEMR